MKSKDESTVFTDTKKLLNYGFDNFQYVNVSKNDTRFNSDTDSLLKSPFSSNVANIVIDSSANILVPKNVKISDLDTTVTFKSEGNSFANITYKYGDKILGTAKIKYLTSESEKESSSESLTTAAKSATDVKETATSQNQNAATTTKTKVTKSGSSGNGLKIILPISIAVIIIIAIIVMLALQRRRINQVRAMKRQRNR